MANKVIVKILDDQYALVTDQSQESLEQAALLVDELMRTFLAGKTFSFDKKTVGMLVALQLACDLLKSRSSEHESKLREEKITQWLDQKLQVLDSIG